MNTEQPIVENNPQPKMTLSERKLYIQKLIPKNVLKQDMPYSNGETFKVQTFFLKLTPEIARVFESIQSPVQRSWHEGRSEGLENDIVSNGRLSNDFFVIDTNEWYVMNGQHRTKAETCIVDPKHFLPVGVLLTNDTESFKIMDSGLNRSNSDRLKGIVNPINVKLISTISNGIIKFENDLLNWGNGGREGLGRQAAIDYTMDNADTLEESAQRAQDIHNHCKYFNATSVGIFLQLSLKDKNKKKREDFIQKTFYRNGSSSPTDVCRNMIIDRAGCTLAPAFSYTQQLGIIINCYNHFMVNILSNLPQFIKNEKTPPFPKFYFETQKNKKYVIANLNDTTNKQLKSI